MSVDEQFDPSDDRHISYDFKKISLGCTWNKVHSCSLMVLTSRLALSMASSSMLSGTMNLKRKVRTQGRKVDVFQHLGEAVAQALRFMVSMMVLSLPRRPPQGMSAFKNGSDSINTLG